MIRCPKCGNSEIWNYLPNSGPNEDGWVCICAEWKPGEPYGFCPELDRDEFAQKVECVIHHLHEAKLIYISNSDEGDSLVASVVATLEDQKYLDCQSIIEAVYSINNEGHREYWKGVTQGVLSGNDTRNRCHCGKLSNSARSSKDGWIYTCKDH